jgi:hypothetical protein
LLDANAVGTIDGQGGRITISYRDRPGRWRDRVGGLVGMRLQGTSSRGRLTALVLVVLVILAVVAFLYFFTPIL